MQNATAVRSLRPQVMPAFLLLLGLVACGEVSPEGGGPESRLAVRAASAGEGIQGQLQRGATALSFSSRRYGDALEAVIRDASGVPLVEYREPGGGLMSIEGADGSALEVPRLPELRILGVPQGVSTPEGLAALQALAEGPEGELLRHLGLELVRAVPGRELMAERRGLEIPLQALWSHLPAEATPAPRLTLDYEVGPYGYLVLTQPPDLVLAVNRVQDRVSAHHDGGQVNDCLGRCGEGCTGGFPGVNPWPWPSEWTDTVGTRFLSQQEYRCMSSRNVLITWYATPTTHSVTGWYTEACLKHDNCCRMNTLLCWTACNSLIEPVAVTASTGEYRTWVYTDYTYDITIEDLGGPDCACSGPECPL